MRRWLSSGASKKNAPKGELQATQGEQTSAALSPQNGTALASSSGSRTALQLVNDEIHVQRGDEPAQPLLEGTEFSIEISQDAKVQIAQKISRLLPDLVDQQKMELMEYTLRVLQVLCKDQLARVRQVVAEELKDYEKAPHDLMFTLATDEVSTVACPVLECSPVLTDQDLVEIIRSSPIPEALEAIASRKRLSSLVSDAIVKTQMTQAISRLLTNHEAAIDDPTYDDIGDRAQKEEALHEALITRPDLPNRIINAVACFVSRSLINRLKEEGRLDPNVEKELHKDVSERLLSPSKNKAKVAKRDAKAMHQSGILDNEVIEDALFGGDYHFVREALAIRTNLPVKRISQVIEAASPKTIMAMCWKAGFSARMGVQIQLRMAKLHHSKVMNARNGKDFPMTEHTMQELYDILTG